MPNIGYSAFTATMKQVGVSLNVPIPYFEAIGNPVFATTGLRGVALTLAGAAPVLLAPIGLGGIFEATVGAYAFANSVSPLVAAGEVVADWRNASNVSPLGPGNVSVRWLNGGEVAGIDGGGPNCI